MQREIPTRETIEVEFKSEHKRTQNGGLKPSRLPDSELIDTVVALSNTNGGEIYLGVEDDGEPTGVHKDRDVTQLAALIANKTVPPVPARVSTLFLAADGSADDSGKQVTLVEIPRSKAIVSSSEGKILRSSAAAAVLTTRLRKRAGKG